MTGRRLPWLLGAMLGLGLLRWLWPPAGPEPAGPVEVIAAVNRGAAMPQAPASRAEAPAFTPRTEPLDVAGNAFSVRVASVNTPPPPPVTLLRPQVAAFMGPPEPPPQVPPPPPPPPPLQVIGTWDDGQAPGVFVAFSQGTVLARVGTVILAEYRVTAVTPQHVALIHTTSRYEWRLPIPRAGSNR